MHCHEARNGILLRDAGEMSAPGLSALDAHLAACPDCARFAADTARLTAAARSAAVPDGPSPLVLDRIRAAAEAAAPRPLLLRRPVLQSLAAAALLLIVVGAATLWPPPGGGPAPESGARTERIADLQAVIAVVSDEQADSAAATAADDEDAALQGLATQLLRMQGLLEDEDALDVLAGEHPATDPQSRSTSALRARRYG